MALKSANQTIRWRQRIGILLIGHTVNRTVEYVYDYMVYPHLLGTYGPLWGWLAALGGSVVLCLLILWAYDSTKQDWLGIETIKLLRDEEGPSRIRKFFRYWMTRGETVMFIVLSCRYDPFITTVYMRHGSGNHTMTSRDWKIFWGSMVVANLWWGGVILAALEIIERWLTPFMPHFMLVWFGLA